MGTVKNDQHGKANRLINESSPYLQQHAYNPVDWFPWGDEALTKAKPASSKGVYLRKAAVSSTMGVGARIDLQSVTA